MRDRRQANGEAVGMDPMACFRGEGMGVRQTGTDGRRALFVLGVAYLIWHVLAMLMAVVCLAVATAAVAHAANVPIAVPDTIAMAGISTPTAAVLAVAWVLVVSASVAGVSLGVAATRVGRGAAPGAGRLALARAMVALCCAQAVVAALSRNEPFLLSSLYSLALAAGILFLMRTGPAVNPAVGADACEEPAVGPGLDSAARRRFKLVRGYTAAMLAWSVLRVLMGLALISGASGGRGPALSAPTVEGGLLVAVGAYMLAGSLVTRRSLAGASSPRRAEALCAFGLCASLTVLVLYAVSFAGGEHGASQDVFACSLDLVLWTSTLASLGRLDPSVLTREK